MAVKRKTLFKLIVDKTKQHPSFKKLKTNRASAPTRWMLDEVFQSFEDADGNFLEQFQTTGFNTRYFELYLHAYFTRSGFSVDRSHQYPDFVVQRSGLEVAVEATTVNPSTSGAVAKHGRAIKDLKPEEMLDYQNHELAIRFGSPLSAKLARKYWEEPHCQGLPFVIAIEAFHDDDSLFFSDNALSRYVFGIEHSAAWTVDGVLEVESKPLSEHVMGDKRIPSGFFALPGAENVSAVVFTNSGTNAKFSRMGFQHGQGNDELTMIRFGTAFDPHPDARDAMYFSYDLDHPPVVESWGQGLVVLHNPRAAHPIPRGWFRNAIDHYMEDGRMVSEVRSWHPMMSQTMIADTGELKKNLKEIPYKLPSISIVALRKQDFQDIVGVDHDENPFFSEVGWYSDDTQSFLGVILLDSEREWGWVVLARNLIGRFAAINTGAGLGSRDEARTEMYSAIRDCLASPKRYFEQGNEFSEVD